jgi:hypothetical protein
VLLAPLDLARRPRYPWPGQVAAWALVAKGLIDNADADHWRSYLVEVVGSGQVPDGPTEAATAAPATRTLVPVGGALALDGHPLALGTPVAPRSRSTLTGNGRAVVVEGWPGGAAAPTPELVHLRRERTVRRTDVLVLSGRLGLARRLGGVTVIPPEHMALQCKGELRPGAEAPWIVLLTPPA